MEEKDSKNNLSNLGNLIKSKRKELGLTQSEVADKIGVTTQHYSRIERSEYVPSLQTFMAISNVLGIDISMLNLSKQRTVSSTMFEIVGLLEKFNSKQQKAVLSLLKSLVL